jgi:hypothetical protein
MATLTPGNTAAGVTHRFGGDPVIACHRGMVSGVRADSGHVIRREFRPTVPPTLSAPSLRRPVTLVVVPGAQPKVCRVHARRVVAGMANHHPGRDRSVVEFVGIAVRQHGPVFRRPEPTIRQWAAPAASPFPAFVRAAACDSGPEPVNRGRCLEYHSRTLPKSGV